MFQHVKPHESHDQPTTQARQLFFFRSKPMSPFHRAPVEATNDLYGIEPPLSPATLHFVYGSHWALCTGLLGGFFFDGDECRWASPVSEFNGCYDLAILHVLLILGFNFWMVC